VIKIDTEICTICGGCIDICPATAISMINDKVIIDNDICTECKICVKICPVNAPSERK
jgi:ferredoxin